VAALPTDPDPRWLDPQQWIDHSVEIDPAALGANTSRGLCLIEDATAELVEINDTDSGNRVPLDLQWRKYRVTAQVEGPNPPGTAGNRIARVQSELRYLLN
jgi:hypothetical protein